MNRPTVAAIIPAYNEEATIAGVVGPLASSKLIDSVLVISDGSTDKTAQRAQAAGARVHSLSQQKGKGEAMRYGVRHTNADVLVFFDADLMGLDPVHVERLLLPVLT